MKEDKSILSNAQEIFYKVENEDLSAIEKTKNPFVLIQLSKLLHGILLFLSC